MWLMVGLSMQGCTDRWDGQPDPYDVDFDIPRSESFPESLSAYGLFEQPIHMLQPAQPALTYELSSELFTDYAHKQRLLVMPEGSLSDIQDSRLGYPDGTILVKTFYYPLDMRDPGAARRIIETRLLVKAENQWNVATYLWNDEQNEATLWLDGTTTEVSWIDETGQTQSTAYAVPHEGECVTCHQADGLSTYLGPTIRNLNHNVARNDQSVNQLSHLQSAGVVESADWATFPTIPNYKQTEISLTKRARAYLDINCAHCHNPSGWEDAANKDVDFRFATPLSQTGLRHQRDELSELLQDGEMPYLGTTLLHKEGIRIVLDYVDTL